MVNFLQKIILQNLHVYPLDKKARRLLLISPKIVMFVWKYLAGFRYSWACLQCAGWKRVFRFTQNLDKIVAFKEGMYTWNLRTKNKNNMKLGKSNKFKINNTKEYRSFSEWAIILCVDTIWLNENYKYYNQVEDSSNQDWQYPYSNNTRYMFVLQRDDCSKRWKNLSHNSSLEASAPSPWESVVADRTRSLSRTAFTPEVVETD
jgi:hypothetical protein